MDDTPILLITGDPALQDLVLTASAALGRTVHHVADVVAVPRGWPRAALVLVGEDVAPELAAMSPSRRDRIFLVGHDANQLAHWSFPLAATPLLLPAAESQVTNLLAHSSRADGTVTAIVGGSGGVGVSTLACGLALLSPGGALLVDADVHGGGLDLLVGAEHEPGMRWSDLAMVRGDLGELSGLPTVDHIDVVSMPRPGLDALPEAALDAIARVGRRQWERVWVDAGRGQPEALVGADRVLVVAAADVRGVAAAQATVSGLDTAAEVGLAVRRVPGGLPGHVVAEEIGIQAWGEIPADRRLIGGAARGQPPHRCAGRRWRRACRRLVEAL